MQSAFGMALVDSTAAFEQRLNEVVSNAATRTTIINGGIRFFSTLAFASGIPQSPPSEAFRAFADNILPMDTTWQRTVLLGDFTSKLLL